MVKVSPYDFFVGIGDINSSFLPKRPELEAKPAKVGKTEEAVGNKGSDCAAASTTTTGDVSAVDRMLSMAGKQDAGSMKEKSEEQDEQLAEQLENRPLLQKQKILDAAEEEALKVSPAAEAAAELLSEDGERKDHELHPSSKYRHNLLQDDDTELTHLGKNLRAVHQAYFDEYALSLSGSKGGRIADLRPGHAKKRSADDQLHRIPDAAQLMASMKSRVLAGVTLVFSGVVPLGVDIQSHDLAVWAKSFGAVVSENLSKRTTHVIASPERRTAKVRQAVKRGGRVKIVTQHWLFACFTQWVKVDEEEYRVHSDAPSHETARLPDSFERGEDGGSGMLSSSDEEAALTEDEPETPAPTNGVSLTLDTNGGDTDVEDLAQFMPSMTRADSSPMEGESPDYWADIKDELDDFLGSDADDVNSDVESVRSEKSIKLKTPPSARKRKREDDGEGGVEADEVGAISQLQKRKKEALGRTSSLTQMVIPANGSSPVVADDPGGGGNGAGDAEVEDDDDDLEAMLAAEMERGSEDGSGT